MRYVLRDGIVCRDIAGIFFAVDINDKHFYRNRQINNLNETAYVLLSIMSNKESFSIEEIVVELESKLSKESNVDHDTLTRDITSFVKQLECRGWVYER